MKRASNDVRRSVFAGAMLAVAVAAVGLWHHRGANRATRSVATGGSAKNAGRQSRWAIMLETTLQQGGSAATVHPGTTTLTGDWVVTVSGATAGHTELACELQHAHVTGTGFGNVDPADVARLERNLVGRFWVSYQDDGAATALHFPREMSDDVRNFLELLVTESQLVRPARPAPQWTATERDGAGSYFAAYEQLGPSEIVKKKMRYLAVDGAGTARAASVNVQVDDAETRFALDDAGAVRELFGHERMHIDAKMGAPGLAIGIRLHMAGARTGRAPELIGSLERALDLETGPVITQRASDQELLARRDARLIKDVTLPPLLESVQRGRADATIRVTLAALLRQRPAVVPPAVAFVRNAEPTPAKLVLDALGAAGTPAAQAALCALASDGSMPTSARVDAVGALIQTKRPTGDTVAALVELMDAAEPAVRRQALYVAGAAGGQSHDADPAASAHLETALLARYEKSRGPARVDLLVALGNLATAAVVSPVEQALRDPSAAVRAGAARALRKVKDPVADRLIAEAMTGDRDPSVRAAAVLAASFRPIGPLVESLAHTVEGDPVDYVRTGAIEAVASHVDESPLVQKALFTAASHDASAGVRRLARQTLGRRLAERDPVVR